MTYHTRTIPKGVLGAPSKIREEFLEFEDAVEQGNIVMAMIELSDAIGAMEAWAANFNVTLEQLIVMKEATRRAFMSGARKSGPTTSDAQLEVDTGPPKKPVDEIHVHSWTFNGGNLYNDKDTLDGKQHYVAVYRCKCGAEAINRPYPAMKDKNFLLPDRILL